MCIESLVKSNDVITSPGYRLFMLNGDIKHKTMLGGLLSILIRLIVIWICVTKAMQLIPS